MYSSFNKKDNIISIPVGNDLSYLLRKVSKIIKIIEDNPNYFVELKVETVIENNNVELIFDQKDTLESTEITSLEESIRYKILIDWLKGLHILHENGFLHGNINPNTLRIKKERHPVNQNITYHGVLSGFCISFFNPEYKPPILYQSPEQLNDEQLDIRSDLYSLGITLYEIFTGTNPLYRHEEHLIKGLIISGKLPSILIKNPTLPQNIGKIIDRMIQHKRSERPATLLEVIPFLGGKVESSKEKPEFIFHPQFFDFNNNIPYVFSKIKERAKAGETQIVIISGTTGSGKTMLSHQLGRIMEKNGYVFIPIEFPQLPWYQLTLINQINNMLKEKIRLDLLTESFTPVGLKMIEKAITKTKEKTMITSLYNFKIYSLLPPIFKRLSQKTKLCLFFDNIHYSVLQQQFNLLKLFEIKNPNLCIILSINEDIPGGQRFLNMLNPVYPNPIRIDLFKLSPSVIEKISESVPEKYVSFPKYNNDVYPSQICLDLVLSKRNTPLTRAILYVLSSLGTPIPLYVLLSLLRQNYEEKTIFDELIELEKIGIVKSVYIEEENGIGFKLLTKILPEQLNNVPSIPLNSDSLSLIPNSPWYIHLKLRENNAPDIEEINVMIKQFIHTPVVGFVLIILDEYQNKIKDIRIQTRIKYWTGVIAYTIGNYDIAKNYLAEVAENTENILKREEKVWSLLTVAWIKARNREEFASEYLKKSLQYIDKNNDEEIARFKAIFSLVYFNQTRIEEAKQALNEALAKNIRKFSETSLELNAIAGYLYYYLTDFEKSAVFFEEALGIAKELRRPHIEAWLSRSIAMPLAFIEPRKAVQSINKSLETYYQIGSIDEVSVVLNNKAMLHFFVGNIMDCLDTSKMAYIAAEMAESVDPSIKTVVLDTLSLAYLANGDFKQAFQSSENALKLATNSKTNQIYSVLEILSTNIIIRHLGGYSVEQKMKELLMLLPSLSSFPLAKEIKQYKKIIEETHNETPNVQLLTNILFKTLKTPLFPVFRYYLLFLWLRAINQSLHMNIELNIEEIYNEYLHIAEQIKSHPIQKIMPLILEILSNKRITQHQFTELYRNSPTNFIQYQITLLAVSLGEKRQVPFVASLLKRYLNKIEPENTEKFLNLFVKNTVIDNLLPSGFNYYQRLKNFLDQITMW